MKSFILLFPLFMFLSCVNPFAPELGVVGDLNQTIITEQLTPTEVLQNFRYAYIYGDSLVYSDIIDTGFVFVYFDPNFEGAGRFDSWGRDTEIKTTAGLFRAVNSISLEWNSTLHERYWSSSEEMSVTDYFDEATGAIISQGFVLKLGTDLQITGSALFAFEREIASTTWHLTRWTDESVF